MNCSLSDGQWGVSPISSAGERMPAWCSWTMATLSWALIAAAKGFSGSMWASEKMPSWPGKPRPEGWT